MPLLAWWRARERGEVVWRGSGRGKQIALTFDDGPEMRYTPRVLAILRRAHAKATFFLEGRKILAHPGLARQIVSEGHAVGNHSFSHTHMDSESRSSIRMEMEACARTLRPLSSDTYLMFRPPWGELTSDIVAEARRHHERIILWSAALEHHEALSPGSMVRRILKLVKPGTIALLHDGGGNREKTISALPLLLDELRKRGYHCVTVPELLAHR
jgi:peptidoglycan/xylan/chitin deacetylase (PgdA/CDA1 family)